MFKLIITGNLGKTAEKKISKDGRDFYVTSVAVKINKEKTEWVNLILGDRFANVSQYLTKGAHVLVEGQPSIQIYEGKGNFSLSVNSIELIGSKDTKESVPF